MCQRDDLKAEGLADEGSGTYGFADGLASGDGSVSDSERQRAHGRKKAGRRMGHGSREMNANEWREKRAPRLPAFRQGRA
jgi:hypothetical protein